MVLIIIRFVMQVKYDIGDGKSVNGNVYPEMEKVSFSKEFIRCHADSIFSVLSECHRGKTGRAFSYIEYVAARKISLHSSGEQLQKLIEDNPLPKSFVDLLTNELRKKEQIKILKGISLRIGHLASLFYKAEELGYSFSHFRFEGAPKNYLPKDLPKFALINDDGSIEKVDGDNLTDGEIKNLIEQSDVLIARLLTKDDRWHCFLQTLKGLRGQEAGKEGGRPHIHYLSDKFCNISFDDLKAMLKSGNYPTTPVHIPIIKQ